MAVQAQPKSTVDRKEQVPSRAVDASIDLYWLPLGAGGRFVRFNGHVYEAIHARLGRRPLDLYHSALEVRVPEGRFVIENVWPIPDACGAARGVTVEGPVGSRRLARFRVFRYEIRRWRDGVIPDVGEAVASPQRLSDDQGLAHRLLELVATVPPLIWGRDEFDMSEMWNSNSVISWLLARSDLRPEEIHPPWADAHLDGQSAFASPTPRQDVVGVVQHRVVENIKSWAFYFLLNHANTFFPWCMVQAASACRRRSQVARSQRVMMPTT